MIEIVKVISLFLLNFCVVFFIGLICFRFGSSFLGVKMIECCIISFSMIGM